MPETAVLGVGGLHPHFLDAITNGTRTFSDSSCLRPPSLTLVYLFLLVGLQGPPQTPSPVSRQQTPPQEPDQEEAITPKHMPCIICGIGESNIWRRDGDGNALCNRCGSSLLSFFPFCSPVAWPGFNVA